MCGIRRKVGRPTKNIPKIEKKETQLEEKDKMTVEIRKIGDILER